MPDALERPEPSLGDPSPPAVALVAAEHLDELLASERVLAVVRFADAPARTDGPRPPGAPGDPRLATVPLRPLGGSAVLEAWRSAGPVASGRRDGIAFAHDGRVLFGHLVLDERSFSSIGAAAYAAYRQIQRFLKERDFPHLARVWNYFPRINARENGVERYQSFCRGRHLALARADAGFETSLPAASALGAPAHAAFVLSFLAARAPIEPIENPRQLSAFRYPRQYGRKSPSFSRSARLSGLDGRSPLLISGTASIVGHETRHPGDALRQLDETLANLDCLLAAARRRAPARLALIRVYLRAAALLPPVEEALRRRFGRELPMVFLEGDICRRDLLLEIEGIAVDDPGPGA